MLADRQTVIQSCSM